MLGPDVISQPSPEAIRAGLTRLTASSGFATAERMRRFIDFVVDETLKGEAGTLKEYRIGVEVFDRGADFDPRTDTIVRVEARRLRKKLQEYYEGEGRTDPVLITVTAGSYAPAFGARDTADASLSGGLQRRRFVVLGVAAVTILALTLAWGLWAMTRRQAGPHTPVTSIAVLPFVDLSQARNQEYLCDGLTEELINALSAVPALKVAARTSAFRFKGKADDVRRVGSDLAVEHIVEGSIRTSGNQLRVTVQLVRVRDGYHVWSRQFDRERAGIFPMQEEVARAVAASVGAELETGMSFPHPPKPEAYRDYLEGRHFGRQFLPASTAQAIALFERAISTDPSFAPAHAGLASSYMQMNVWRGAPTRELVEKARAAATRALSLDPSSAEAETELGAISGFYDWDWKKCEQHFRRAMEAQPNYVAAHWMFATICLAPQGRLDEALAEARRATALDPLSPLAQTMAGAAYWYRREFDKALEAYDAALRLDPSYGQASLFQCFTYIAQGRMDLAAASQHQGMHRAYIQARLGNRAAAQAQVEEMIAARANPLAIAAGYAGLREQEKSLEWLKKAADAKIPQIIWINFQAAFEPLHGTAGYRAIRAGMHLP